MSERYENETSDERGEPVWAAVKEAILRAMPGDDAATSTRRIELFLTLRALLRHGPGPLGAPR